MKNYFHTISAKETKNMTKEDLISLHIELWNDIAENSIINKNDSFIFRYFKSNFYCFACDIIENTHYLNCSSCNLADIDNNCYLYSHWVDYKRTNNQLAKQTAIEIADALNELQGV